jgi:hypothetical protein
MIPKMCVLHPTSHSISIRPIILSPVSKCKNNMCRRLVPCFPQADLLVRSLLSDPAVGYIPPFIVIIPYQGANSPHAQALFTHPSHAPPSELTRSWPSSCGSPNCPETDCGSFDFNACRALSPDSKMVRKGPWPGKRTACNFWGCEVLHKPEEGSTLMQCRRCKEAFYCTSTHQVRLKFVTFFWCDEII